MPRGHICDKNNEQFVLYSIYGPLSTRNRAHLTHYIYMRGATQNRPKAAPYPSSCPTPSIYYRPLWRARTPLSGGTSQFLLAIDSCVCAHTKSYMALLCVLYTSIWSLVDTQCGRIYICVIWKQVGRPNSMRDNLPRAHKKTHDHFDWRV